MTRTMQKPEQLDSVNQNSTTNTLTVLLKWTPLIAKIGPSSNDAGISYVQSFSASMSVLNNICLSSNDISDIHLYLYFHWHIEQ